MVRSVLIIFLICLVLATVGCIPLKQQETVAKSNSDFFASYMGGYLLIGFGGDLAEMNYKLIDEKSQVIGPNNARYSVFHQNHPYDVERGSRNPRVQLRIKNSRGKTIRFWGNGIWQLSLVARDRNGQQTFFEQEFKLWTFYYSPFIHGAPN
jgi:hypothetical protein